MRFSQVIREVIAPRLSSGIGFGARRGVKRARKLAEVRDFIRERARAEDEHFDYYLERFIGSLAFLPGESGRLLEFGEFDGVAAEVFETFFEFEAEAWELGSEELPFQSESFDIIAAGPVLETHPESFLFELRRVLKRTGYLVVSAANSSSWKSIARALKHEPPLPGGPAMSFIQFKELLERSGFRILRHEAVDVVKHVPEAAPIEGFDEDGRGDTSYILAQKAEG